jgi:hypothetical protein
MALMAAFLLGGCGTPPKSNEVVWATVAEIYTPEKLARSYNRALAARAVEEGLNSADIEAGRLVKVGCGIGPDYSWGAYAYAPKGLNLREEQVVRVAVTDVGDDNRMGWNRLLGPVENFGYRGSMPAYRFIPDWRERGLSRNIEQINLEPGQRGRYAIVHSQYLIKCRQGD